MVRKENDREFPTYLFHQGTNYKAQELLGAHMAEDATEFVTWAPHAQSVCIVGDFNDWGKGEQIGRASCRERVLRLV